MTTEFDKLLSVVNNLNNRKGEKCMVCHFPDNKKNLIKLSCNHYYHNNCITIINFKFNCPYCKKTTTFKRKNDSENVCKFVLKSGINRGKHCNRVNCKYHKIKTKSIACKSIIANGPNKGQVCNRFNCKYHKNLLI